jgi:hypothetical protein
LASKIDPASVQFAWNVRAPKGTGITKQVLKDALDYYRENGHPPRGFTVRAIAWRNSARKGALQEWRWSEGSNKEFLKKLAQKTGVPLEKSPRGSHDLAVETLGGLLQGFQF